MIVAAGRAWSADDVATVRRMVAARHLMKDVARRFGVSPRSLRNAVVREKLGIQTRRGHGGNNNVGRLAAPKDMHPLLARIYAEINAQRTTGKEVSLRAGLNHRAVYLLRDNSPTLATIEAIAGVLGLRVTLARGDA